ncbi:MAG: hypothetical protein WBD36_00340 [Bacteroidota bacterium]
MVRDASRLSVVLAHVLLFTTKTAGQIPSGGSDFGFLDQVHWGMSLEAARDSLNSFHPSLAQRPMPNLPPDDPDNRSRAARLGLQETSDTVLVVPFDLLGEKARATLFFSIAGKRLCSASIAVQEATDELFRKVLKTLELRHGPPSDYQKKQETKLFFTFDFELRSWKTQSQLIALVDVLLNASVQTFTIDYTKLLEE